ncbi:B3/B4 domain-containing protein [Priestia flexa]|uniref:Phenylalanine--tRNA ligase beta subunit-related protein n=1 Tax=Priestia flexa TaxID=86664 RepID=A0ABU4J993_9BACI|nr:phenylalanine--tRNA ligase beta subunit-related protein [Priestia flexa]MDW8517578.1 phenylalanine--tRNA ligase beta subunit-related protein [Priestia flexa]
MNVIISPEIKEKNNDIKLGIIHYRNIKVSEAPQMLKGRLRLFQESIYFDLQDRTITSFEGIKEWRCIFKEFGTDPSKYRPSIEALFRRIQKQTYLPTINSAVDLNNFFSLQYEVPLGIYDKSCLNGDISLRLGNEDESYLAINGREVSLYNKLVLADEQGPFGSPYVDSNRAPVSEQTSEALQIIFLKPSLSTESSLKLTESLSTMFTQIHGGEASYSLIN